MRIFDSPSTSAKKKRMKIKRRYICRRARLSSRRLPAQRTALPGAATHFDAAACCISVKDKNKKKNLLKTMPCLKPRRRHFRPPLSAATFGRYFRLHFRLSLSAATLDCIFRLPIQAVMSSWRQLRLHFAAIDAVTVNIPQKSKCLFPSQNGDRDQSYCE